MVIEILVSIFFVVGLFCNTSTLGFSTDSPFLCRLTYIFFHKNIFHLLVNLYAYHVSRKVIVSNGIRSILPLCYFVAFLATFFTEHPQPTIGLSGVIYSMVAVIFYYYVPLNKYYYIAFMLLCNLLSMWIGGANSMLHILSFVYTFIILFIWEKTIKKRLNKLKPHTDKEETN